MKPTTLHILIMLTLLLTLQLSSSPPAFAQTSAFTLSTLAKRGDTVPGSGRFVDCDDCIGALQGLHALNNRGDVLAGGETRGTCLVAAFTVSNGVISPLANYCDSTPFGKFILLGPGGLNNSGTVSEVDITQIDAADFLQMINLFQSGALTKIAAVGEPSPAGSVFGSCGFNIPSINNMGDVAFGACGDHSIGLGLDGVFYSRGGTLHKLAISGDPSPANGPFNFFFLPPPLTTINDSGAVLFQAAVNPSDGSRERPGLFLGDPDGGFHKIVVGGDSLPGGTVPIDAVVYGDLNNNGDVAFRLLLDGPKYNEGVFLYSGGQMTKIAKVGDQSPMGTPYSSFMQRTISLDQRTPGVNDNHAVVFKAFYNKGHATGIFMGSGKATIKVAALGDLLPTGDVVGDIASFAINPIGQVAFFAYKKGGSPIGVFLATPVAPVIAFAKLKQKSGNTTLTVNGSGFITNDSVIEVDQQPLSVMLYPDGFQTGGGTTARVVSADSRLAQLISSGKTVQITVFNPLTNLRSAPVSLTGR